MKRLQWLGLILLVTFAIFTQTAHAQSVYRVGVGDTLSIEVLQDPSLNRTTEVLPGGNFTFPFAGDLPAAGRTVGEIQAAIRDGIASNFASPPDVFVSVQPLRVQRQPRTETPKKVIDVYLLGEIANPGLVEVAPRTTLLQAIAVGGGVSQFAATKRIQLRRTDGTGQQNVTLINYKALSNGATLSQDIELKDGDIILIPERRLFE